MENQPFDIQLPEEAPFKGFYGEHCIVKFEPGIGHDHFEVWVGNTKLFYFHISAGSLFLNPENIDNLHGEVHQYSASIFWQVK